MAAKYWVGGTGTWATAGRWSTASGKASFTASRPTGTNAILTVTAVTSGTIAQNQLLYDSTGTARGTIGTQISGTTGGTGTYNTTASSGALTSQSCYTMAAASSTTAPASGSTDEIIFDANSGPSPTVTIGATAYAGALYIGDVGTTPGNVITTSINGTLTLTGTSTLNVYGNMWLPASGLTWTHTGSLTFLTAAAASIKSNNQTISSPVIINYSAGASPTYALKLVDNFKTTAACTFTSGWIDATNGGATTGSSFSCLTFTSVTSTNYHFFDPGTLGKIILTSASSGTLYTQPSGTYAGVAGLSPKTSPTGTCIVIEIPNYSGNAITLTAYNNMNLVFSIPTWSGSGNITFTCQNNATLAFMAGIDAPYFTGAIAYSGWTIPSVNAYTMIFPCFNVPFATSITGIPPGTNTASGPQGISMGSGLYSTASGVGVTLTPIITTVIYGVTGTTGNCTLGKKIAIGADVTLNYGNKLILAADISNPSNYNITFLSRYTYNTVIVNATFSTQLSFTIDTFYATSITGYYEEENVSIGIPPNIKFIGANNVQFGLTFTTGPCCCSSAFYYANIKNLDVSNFTGKLFTQFAGAVRFSGNLDLSYSSLANKMTDLDVVFANASPITFNLGTNSIRNLNFLGTNSVTLASNIITTYVYFASTGTFNTNNYNINCSGITLSGSPTINLGSSTINAKDYFDLSGSSTAIVNAGTSTINIGTNGFNANVNMGAGNYTLNNVICNPVNAPLYTFSVFGSNGTINNFTNANITASGCIIYFANTGTLNFRSFSLNGTATYPLQIIGTGSTQHTINNTTTSYFTCNYVTISYINATQSGTPGNYNYYWFAGPVPTGSTNGGNNTGWAINVLPIATSTSSGKFIVFF